MHLPFLPLTLTGRKDEMPELSPADWQRRVEQRQKHLNIVKGRESYKAYVDRVPKEERNPRTPREHPVTPDPKKKDISVRRWRDAVNKWSWRLKELHHQHGGPDPQAPEHAPAPDPARKKRWADYSDDSGSDTELPPVPAPARAPASTTEDTELVEGEKDYDSDEMAEDMEALALQGRPATPRSPKSYAELVRPRVTDNRSKRAATPTTPTTPPPFPPERHSYASIVRPPAKKPAWASVVRKVR